MVQAHAHELLNQKNTQNAHPLVLATQRLMAALDRLERGLQLSEAKDADTEELLVIARENDTLRAEREDLNGTISELQQQYDDLHKVAGTIYNKLDDSIKRLTQIIGS
jgi:uncharacterized protein YlxW (UPF0749 family)